jgi:hypothetical protein
MFCRVEVSALAYVSSDHYPFALVARNPRHRIGLAAWLLLYMFVAIQLAWVLRPFVGSPELPTGFFRQEVWGNAYVQVSEAVLQLIGG